MKIGIDVTASIYEGTGVAGYYRSLIPELLKQGSKHKFVLLGYAMRQFDKLDLANKKYFLPPRIMEFLWNRLHRVPVERFVGDVDVFHAWDYLQPPAAKAKLVTTIHDLTALKFPMYHHSLTVEAQKNRLKWVRREAQMIIADSKSAKEDIMELLGIPEKKIAVIYLAAAENYKQFQQLGDEPRLVEIIRVRKKYGITGDYFLSVGTVEPRKNLKRVMEAFTISREKLGVQTMVVAGRAGWGEQLMPMENVLLLGKIQNEDLPALYAGAAALVYPSLYEGFGLPLLEAMSVGCPVIASEISSLAEVAGKAGVLVEPEKVESIAAGMGLVLENRRKFIELGYKQAEKFSWQKTAEETLKVYESLGR